MKKYDFYRQFDIDELQIKTKQTLLNKYYNVWMNKFEWEGLDEDNKEQEENYIMRKFWSDGTIAGRPISNTDMLIFCPWTANTFNTYDFPDSVMLVNQRGVSTRIIPKAKQIVNKDVVLIYAQPNHKSIKMIADYYIDRISQVEMVINTNLNLQKMPFLIGVTEEDKKQLDDVVNRILNDEVVVFTSISDLNKVQAMVTNAPYIIDKLKAYESSLENELLTYLGIDNTGSQEKAAQLTVDEVNANNDAINEYGKAIEDEINRGLERFNKVFNRNISIKCKAPVVDTTSDQEVLGHEQDMEEEDYE